MGFVRTALAMVCLSLALYGCNTTDALTPQVDVGGGHFPTSNPVTERDLQQMSENRQPVYPTQPQMSGSAAEAPVSGQPLPPPAPAAGNSSMSSNAPVYSKRATGAPPRTLEQQAAALPRATDAGKTADENAGTEPQAETPARRQSPALAAPADEQPQAAPATAAAQPAQSGASPVSGAPAGETIRFLPIIGAPLAAVTPLSRQLGAEARARGITIRSSSDAAAGHVLKGYFSSVAGGGTITVTYVWDVLDANGARLNRIQGQESFPGNAKDPWSAVPPSVMQNIATKTMDSYTRWRAGP